MPTNEILPFAGASSNIPSQADYAASSTRTAGVVSGTASSAYANKAWRQASFVAAVLAQFIADNQPADVLDDADDAALQAQLEAALLRFAQAEHGQQYFTSSGTFTVPSNVTKVYVEVWGGGGGSSGNAGSSGAGGGYAAGYLAVTPGAGVAVTVGAAGTAGASGSGAGAGGTSSISTVSATGGAAGNGGPGAGGVGSGGTLNITGQGGTDLDGTNTDAAGGCAPRGGLGGLLNNAGSGNTPTVPGGGGGASSGSTTGQAGAVGAVLVSW